MLSPLVGNVQKKTISDSYVTLECMSYDVFSKVIITTESGFPYSCKLICQVTSLVPKVATARSQIFPFLAYNVVK